MFDPSPYVAALGGVKTAVEIVQTLRGLAKSDPEIKDKLSDLYSTILNTQDALLKGQIQQSALLDENKALRAKINEIEDWKRDAERYRLTKLPGGVFVFSLQQDQENGEPSHKLCTTCYQQKKKSILHELEDGQGMLTLRCMTCLRDIYANSQESSSRGRDEFGPDGSPWTA